MKFNLNKAAVLMKNVQLFQSNAQSATVETGSNSNKHSFQIGIFPIYYFLRAFGLLPFSIEYESNGEILWSCC